MTSAQTGSKNDCEVAHGKIQQLASLDSFDRWAENPGECPVVVQGLDLRERSSVLARVPVDGSVFLGCTIETASIGPLFERGATVVPGLDILDAPAHPSELYTPQILFDSFEGGKYSESQHFDKRIYEAYVKAGLDTTEDVRRLFAYRLHDLAMTDAAAEFVKGRKMVGIMGGHSVLRGSGLYREIACLARELTALGFTMVTGGGPGAMEAAHVGAWFVTRPESDLNGALAILSDRDPSDVERNGKKEYSDEYWLDRAFRTLEAYPLPSDPAEAARCASLGIPTWRYGHEPPAAFATHIAKYFANSIREDGLLTLARAGIVFAPGRAGTVQEVFQDATQNYYPPEGESPSPMIFLDHEEFWTKTLRAPELLQSLMSLGNRADMAKAVSVVNSREEVIRALQA